ncbi:unnamed protein product [Pieris macdunnoughi]|uniref:PiggyBac transposable element-derived protein domain-containing protein n=1 Tax=Pieris macdunnoughi TaxID=345717 RepID=A0A821MUQ2_9NEOP|nr:unnamed protein product [Pieris macdunnoughi]
MMIPYKGRKAGNRKQYMKDKPSKWGFKNYVRAGVSGMIYDFILYAGHFPSTKEDMGRCKFCQKITTVYCIKCNVRLCFVTGKNPFKYKLLTNCFLHFHNK